MLQQIRLANWLLEVDIIKTREFYKEGINVCSCLYCNNFVDACKHLDSSVADVFNKLGIDPAMPAHLSQFPTIETMRRLYTGHYHLVGRVLEGELSTSSKWNETNTIEIKNFIFGFSEDLEFVPGSFPNPVLQLEIEAEIQWVLDEKPDEN
ncbi:hypothetical protein [Metabacillus litoralis]|uniref:hypothetical protein n=1 Tax=Metabacillus litoralis TaxID=152268 RepID=UPI00203DFC96|nr:hypothetical protein [Metabacillus litoralis]MCM3163394.1 hypothetical protein [Metabacillus litoralis]